MFLQHLILACESIVGATIAEFAVGTIVPAMLKSHIGKVGISQEMVRYAQYFPKVSSFPS